MLPQELRAFDIGPGFQRVQVSGKRRFRIHHHRLAARQVNHHVWTQPPVLGAPLFLLEEVAAVEHARHFGYAPKLNLAPAATALGDPQRRHQVIGLRA